MQRSFSRETTYQFLRRHLMVGLAILSVAIGLLATAPAEAVVAQPQVTNIWHGNLKVGQELFVGLLDRSASTGYRWVPEPAPAGLTLSEKLYYPENPAPGSPAVRGYTINVASCSAPSCSYAMNFNLVPPGSTEAFQVVEVKIVSEPSSG